MVFRANAIFVFFPERVFFVRGEGSKVRFCRYARCLVRVLFFGGTGAGSNQTSRGQREHPCEWCPFFFFKTIQLISGCFAFGVGVADATPLR